MVAPFRSRLSVWRASSADHYLPDSQNREDLAPYKGAKDTNEGPFGFSSLLAPLRFAENSPRRGITQA